LTAKDESALRELMGIYGDELMRTAYLLVKDRQTAEEAVMDTFIQAYAKIGQLREPDKLRGWLLRIVINRCRMTMRLWSWRSLRFSLQLKQEHQDGSMEDGPEERLLAEWRNGRLSDAVRGLDYRQREAIVCYYYNGMSVNETAQLLDLNPNTVKARLARGRTQLKDILEKEGL
jgi:RNA polymerase sigma factor (sigma-70 family)